MFDPKRTAAIVFLLLLAVLSVPADETPKPTGVHYAPGSIIMTASGFIDIMSVSGWGGGFLPAVEIIWAKVRLFDSISVDLSIGATALFGSLRASDGSRGYTGLTGGLLAAVHLSTRGSRFAASEALDRLDFHWGMGVSWSTFSISGSWMYNYRPPTPGFGLVVVTGANYFFSERVGVSLAGVILTESFSDSGSRPGGYSLGLVLKTGKLLG